MDKAHDGVYPFDMTHIQETPLDLTQELISLKLLTMTKPTYRFHKEVELTQATDLAPVSRWYKPPYFSMSIIIYVPISKNTKWIGKNVTKQFKNHVSLLINNWLNGKLGM